jgi:serine/threonine protein kinase
MKREIESESEKGSERGSLKAKSLNEEVKEGSREERAVPAPATVPVPVPAIAVAVAVLGDGQIDMGRDDAVGEEEHRQPVDRILNIHARSGDEGEQEKNVSLPSNDGFVADVMTLGWQADGDGDGDGDDDDAKNVGGVNEKSGSRSGEGGESEIGYEAEVDADDQEAEGKKLKFPDGFITEFEGIEDIRELSSSRFGTVRLVRRRSEKGDKSEVFVAKFYNSGDNKESRSAFMECVHPFICLNHPSVMPIRGIIGPVKGTGPIVLTPFSECGSLEDVLNQVRKNDPPPFWNNSTITKIIFNLITSLEYLHRQGIVLRELKPSDVIVYPDGTARVDGYLTSFLEEQKFTKASQVGSPFYMSPEVYDDEEEGVKSKDPKTDVFSFALIAFELVAIARVFPTSMAAATIMRKVMSARRDDRPKITDNVPGPISDLIHRCWVPLPSKRPTFEDILRQMNAIQFRFFPDVDLILTMPISSIEETSHPLLDASSKTKPMQEDSNSHPSASKTRPRSVRQPH